jgi:hypothetical protein
MAGCSDFFTAPLAGFEHVATHSPRPPKLTRSQQRYQAYLDADGSMRFGEWLKCRPTDRGFA